MLFRTLSLRFKVSLVFIVIVFLVFSVSGALQVI